jgi:hypothetical protein
MLYGSGKTNPANLAGQYLQQTPLVQSLLQGQGYPTGLQKPFDPNAVQLMGGTAGAAGQSVTPPSNITGTPGWQQFQFVQGRKLPMRETLQFDPQGSMSGLLSGLAAFSGQNIADFWADFQAAAPQGGKNPLTRWAY